MKRVKYAFFFLLAIGSYFSLTWFFFGSPHPCGILEARQQPYVLNYVEKKASEDRELAALLLKDSVTRPTGIEMLQDIRKRPQQMLEFQHERIWRLTPAQCFWRAMAWDPDPYKKE